MIIYDLPDGDWIYALRSKLKGARTSKPRGISAIKYRNNRGPRTLYVYQNVSLRLMSEKWSGLTGRYNETSGQLEILKKLFDQAVIGTLN